MADSDNIRVCCRVRPANERETQNGGGDSLIVDKENKAVMLKQDPSARFVFDGVLDSTSTQDETFEMVGRWVRSPPSSHAAGRPSLGAARTAPTTHHAAARTACAGRSRTRV